MTDLADEHAGAAGGIDELATVWSPVNAYDIIHVFAELLKFLPVAAYEAGGVTLVFVSAYHPSPKKDVGVVWRPARPHGRNVGAFEGDQLFGLLSIGLGDVEDLGVCFGFASDIDESIACGGERRAVCVGDEDVQCFGCEIIARDVAHVDGVFVAWLVAI